MKMATTILALVLPCAAQQTSIADPNQLVGKQVIVQRVPLCRPGTFESVLSYAGKQATVVSIKPSNLIPPMSKKALDMMKPEARAMIEDARKAATLLLQFEDGTRLDTCAPIGPTRLASYLELAPGQAMATATETPATSSPNSGAAVTPAVAELKALKDMLSDEEVRRAVNGEGRDHSVMVEDMGLMAAQGNQVPAITLFMPEAVLAIRAQTAKRQFIQYQPDEEDKRRSLMVIARGYAGKTISEGCTSITRVVLVSEPSGRIVKEAYLSEPLGETWRNGFGATNECQALRAKFLLDDVHQVASAAPNGEFMVAVFSGTVRTKMYKVKRKHQSKLGLKMDR